MATVTSYDRCRFSQDEWNDFVSWVAEKAPEVPGDETMWEKTGRMPSLAAYTRLRYSEGQDQIIFIAWK
jgi:hypothetical protein